MKMCIRIILILVAGFLFSCKRNFNNDLLGPERSSSAALVKPFQTKVSEVDFSSSPTNSVGFNAEFDKRIRWKITLTGLKSQARKTFTGVSSTIPANVNWFGEQDSLYFFRDNEPVIAVLSIDNSYSETSISNELNNRGEIFVDERELARDTIVVIKRKRTNPNQIELFPKYLRVGECSQNRLFQHYTVGYDIEGEGDALVSDLDKSVIKSESAPQGLLIEAVMDSASNFLRYASYQGGLKGPRFFIMKGQDVNTKVKPNRKDPNGINPDYYIGRLASVNLKNPADIGNRLTFGGNPNPCNPGVTGINVTEQMEKAGSPENLYFNVFVYGNNDGSKINYTIKEDEDGNNTYQDENGDESYEKAIVVDFYGWRLFSFKYSDFTHAQWINPNTGKVQPTGDGKKEIKNIIQVQFGLVASGLGGTGQAIIDNPVVSWGAPFKY